MVHDLKVIPRNGPSQSDMIQEIQARLWEVFEDERYTGLSISSAIGLLEIIKMDLWERMSKNDA